VILQHNNKLIGGPSQQSSHDAAIFCAAWFGTSGSCSWERPEIGRCTTSSLGQGFWWWS